MARVLSRLDLTKRQPKRDGKNQGQPKKPVKLTHLHKPEDMALEDWQRELRHQFGRQQDFVLKNIGTHPVFSEFQVTNPENNNTYRVAIRGSQPGENFCSCPDFATN